MKLNNLFMVKSVNKNVRKNFKELLKQRDIKYADGVSRRGKDLQYPFQKMIGIDLHEGRTTDVTPIDVIGKAMFGSICQVADREGDDGYNFLIDFIFDMMLEAYGISEEEALKELKVMYKWRDENLDKVNAWIEEVRPK